MQRDVVLDPKTGLPEVRASRSQDGQVTFRVHVLQSGGGSIFSPVSDATHQLLRDQYGEPAADWEERISRVQKMYAATMDKNADDTDAVARLEELTAEHAALAEQVESERTRADEAELKVARYMSELAAMRKQDEAEGKPPSARSRGKQAA
jgi:uncharacterized Zn finger protein (UPF0148 family)